MFIVCKGGEARSRLDFVIDLPQLLINNISFRWLFCSAAKLCVCLLPWRIREQLDQSLRDDVQQARMPLIASDLKFRKGSMKKCKETCLFSTQMTLEVRNQRLRHENQLTK